MQGLDDVIINNWYCYESQAMTWLTQGSWLNDHPLEGDISMQYDTSSDV